MISAPGLRRVEGIDVGIALKDYSGASSISLVLARQSNMHCEYWTRVCHDFHLLICVFEILFPIPEWIPLRLRGRGGNGKTNSSVKVGAGGCQSGWQVRHQVVFPPLYLLESLQIWKGMCFGKEQAGREQLQILLLSLSQRITKQFCMSKLIISPSLLKNNIQKLQFRLFKKSDQQYYLSSRSWGNINFSYRNIF